MDIFQCIQLHLAHLPSRGYLDCELLHLTDSEGHRIYSEMNTCDWWWDTPGQYPAGATIVSVIWASDKTVLTNCSSAQHACQLNLTIGNIQRHIRWTLKRCALFHVSLNPCPPNDATKIENAWYSAVGTVLSQLRYLDITGPGLKWDFADAFQQQYYPLLAAWVGDYPERIIVSWLSYGSFPMCEVPQHAPMGHFTFWPLDYWRERHI